MLLEGDAIKSETYFTPSQDGHNYASQLVNQISDLNNGKYLEDLEISSKTDFCIGVAGYPEKHMEAPSLESDIHFLKEKIKLGADYIVTQMFFDNDKFFKFKDICEKEGINVPIIPGTKAYFNKKTIEHSPSQISL